MDAFGAYKGEIMDGQRVQKNVGFWFRVFSFQIDLFILIIISQLIASLFFYYINIEKYFVVNIIITLVVFVSLAFGVECVFMTSVGKLVFGIETIKNDNSKLSKKDVVIKTVLKIIYPIEAFVLIFSKPKRTIANRITKTDTVWKNEKTKSKLIRFLVAIISIIFLMNLLLISMSCSYMNTDIFSKSTDGVKAIIANGNDKSIDYIDKYNFSPNNIQIVNTQGFVIRKIITKNNKIKYLKITLSKKNNEWIATSIKTIDKPSGKGFSISYSLKK
jgi:hypothetical protein